MTLSTLYIMLGIIVKCQQHRNKALPLKILRMKPIDTVLTRYIVALET